MESLSCLWLDGRHDQTAPATPSTVSDPDHARHRRARQDRPSCRRAPRRTGPRRPRRSRARPRRRSTGTTPTPGRPRSTARGAAYITFQPDLAVPRRGRHHRGVRRAPRGRTASTGSSCCRAAANPRRKHARSSCSRSGVDTTVVPVQLLRPELQRALPSSTRCVDGVIAFPAGEVREPIIDADDIADVAVGALTEPGHEQRVYELHRAAVAVVRRDGRRSSARPPAARSCTCRSRPTSTPPAAIAAGFPTAEAEDARGRCSGHIFDGHNESVTDGRRRDPRPPGTDFTDLRSRRRRDRCLVANLPRGDRR